MNKLVKKKLLAEGSVPLACDTSSLTPSQNDTRMDLLGEAVQSIRRVVESDEGYLFLSLDQPGRREKILRLIELERKCCPFLNFSLVEGSTKGEIGIRIAGGKTILRLIAKVIGLSLKFSLPPFARNEI